MNKTLRTANLPETIAALKRKAEKFDRIGQHEYAHKLRNRCAALQIKLHTNQEKMKTTRMRP